MKVQSTESRFIENVVHYNDARSNPSTLSNRSRSNTKGHSIGYWQIACVSTTEGWGKRRIGCSCQCDSCLLSTSVGVVFVGGGRPDTKVPILGKDGVGDSELALVASDVLVARAVESLNTRCTSHGEDIRWIDDFNVAEQVDDAVAVSSD